MVNYFKTALYRVGFIGIVMVVGVTLLFAAYLYLDNKNNDSVENFVDLSGDQFTIGESAKINNLVITVKDARLVQGEAGQASVTPNPENYLVTNLEIQNTGEDVEYFLPRAQAVLATMEGAILDQASITDLSTYMERRINPSQSITTEVAWKIPEGLAGQELNLLFDLRFAVIKVEDAGLASSPITVIIPRHDGEWANFVIDKIDSINQG